MTGRAPNRRGGCRKPPSKFKQNLGEVSTFSGGRSAAQVMHSLVHQGIESWWRLCLRCPRRAAYDCPVRDFTALFDRSFFGIAFLVDHSKLRRVLSQPLFHRLSR